MTSDITNELKGEIESYLSSCGLFETLRVFRKEFGARLGNDEEEAPFRCNKSTLAKRYFENKAEIGKTGWKISCARKKLASFSKEQATFHMKLKDLKKLCLKHALLDLELLNALNSKMPAIASSGKSVVMNRDSDSGWEKFNAHLKKYVKSILTDGNCCKEENSLSNNPSNDDLEEFDIDSDASSVSSDFPIISDEELRNIHPLSSVISLSSREVVHKSVQRSTHTIHACSENISAPWQKAPKDFVATSTSSCRQFSEQCFNARQVSYCRSMSSNCTSLRSYWQRDKQECKIGVNKGKGLRKWCENFLKPSNLIDEDEPRRDCCTESIYSDTSLASSSMFSSDTTLNKVTDSPESEVNLCVTSDKNIKEFGPSSMSNKWTSDRFLTRSAITDDLVCPSPHQHKNMTPFWKETPSFHENTFKINVAEHDSKLLRILHNKCGVERSQELDFSNNQHVEEIFFPVTQVSENEKKMMADKAHRSMFSNTPPGRNDVKEKKFSIYSNNHGQVKSSTCDIQNGSRLKMVCVKETDRVSKCSGSTLRHSFSLSDKSPDKVQKTAKLPNNNNSCDLNLFPRECRIIRESNSRQSLRKLTSASSLKSCLHEQRAKTYKTSCLDIDGHDSDSRPMRISDYFEFEKDLKPFRSSSVIDFPDLHEMQKSEKLHSNWTNDSVSHLFESGFCGSDAEYQHQDKYREVFGSKSLAEISMCNVKSYALSSVKQRDFISESFCCKPSGDTDSFPRTNHALRRQSVADVGNKPVQRILRTSPLISSDLGEFSGTRNYRTITRARKSSSIPPK